MATEVNKILLELEFDSKGVIINLDQVQAKLKAVGVDLAKAGKQFQDFGKAAKNGSSAAGIAGAAAAELGRTISDLPYGINAITNNVSQLGSMFSLLVVKTGSAKEALKELLKVFKGPAGFLIVFQIAVAALELFTQKQGKAQKQSRDLNDEIASSTSKLTILKQAIDEQSLSFERLSILVRQANDENKNLNLSLQESEESYRSTSEQIVGYVKAIELAARAKAVQSAIEDEFKEILKEQDEQAKSTVASYNFIGRAYASIKGTIVDFYQAISGSAVTSEAKISESQFRITQLLIELDALFAQGLTGDPKKSAEKGANEIAELQERLALIRIKIEEDRLKKELEFIDKRLTKEKEGEAEYLKLQIKREEVLDSLNDISKDRFDEEEKRKERLRDLEKDITLALISDQRERLRQQIDFIDQEILKEEEGTVKYKELQLEKIKAVRALAAAEKKVSDERAKEAKRIDDERIKEDERVNDLRTKLFRARISESEVLERKWLKSQIESLSTILESESLSNEQRAQSELDLYNYKKELLDREQEDKESILNSLTLVLETLGEIFSAQAEREIAVETNKTNQINDQLKQRLANEQLSADERDRINQQISRNEAALVAKENEINKKRFEQQKALQLATATAELYRTAFLAYGSQLIIGDPTSPIRAQIAQGVALAAGLASIAMIARSKFTGKAMPSPNLSGPGVGGGGGAEPQFNVIGATGQNQLAAAIAETQQQPVKAYVVSNDVTTAQSLDRNIVAEASL
jgi:hypothetical protein